MPMIGYPGREVVRPAVVAERGEDAERDADQHRQREGHDAELDGDADAIGDDVVDAAVRELE